MEALLMWLAAQLVGWLVAWLLGCLVAWLVEWLVAAPARAGTKSLGGGCPG